MNERCQSVRRTATVHAQPCGREENHSGSCSFADGNGQHLWLDGYEIANLCELFKVLTDAPAGNPLYVFNNGDWLHQLKRKFNDAGYLHNNPPNETADVLWHRFSERLNAWEKP